MAALQAILVTALAIGVTGSGALADDTAQTGPVYRLDVVATDRIDNDRLTAVLAVEVEGDDPTALAADINRRMQAALAIVEPMSALQVETRDYRIAPAYDPKGRTPRRWTGRQTLVLESDDTAAAVMAIDRLQDDLQVQSLDFGVSAETRAATSDRLIVDALLRFEARAALIARTVEAVDHRVLEADVLTEEGRFGGQPRLTMRAQSASDAAPPSLSGGSTELTVRVSGRIELLDE